MGGGYSEIYKEMKEGKLYIQRWFPENDVKAVVCLVHGLGEHSGRYEDLASYLLGYNYSLTALDLPGHGKSFGPRGHVSSYKILMDSIEVLIREAEHTYSDLPIILYGHSMGGNLVLNYVFRKKPDLRGLIVSAPWLRLKPETPKIKALLGKAMNKILPQFSQPNGIDPALLTHSKEEIEKYIKDPLVHDQISARLYVEVAEAGKWVIDNASHLDLSTLIMVGAEDKIVSVDAVKQFAESTAGKCIYKEWPGLYHEIHNEIHNQKVYSYILEWLEDNI